MSLVKILITLSKSLAFRVLGGTVRLPPRLRDGRCGTESQWIRRAAASLNWLEFSMIS